MTGGMDILSDHRMVITTQEALKQISREFQVVKDAADHFVKWANAKVEEQDEDTDIEVEAALPQKRVNKKKSISGEMAEDEPTADAERAYEVGVHNQILDTASEAIQRRFLTYGTLISASQKRSPYSNHCSP